METSSRLNVREASHSRFTWEKRQNRMEAVFPHSVGDVLCSEVTPSKFLCWCSAASVTLLRVGVLRDSCSGGGSSHMWDKGPFRGCSWFLFCQCDIRGVNWRKGMLIEKIPASRRVWREEPGALRNLGYLSCTHIPMWPSFVLLSFKVSGQPIVRWGSVTRSSGFQGIPLRGRSWAEWQQKWSHHTVTSIGARSCPTVESPQGRGFAELEAGPLPGFRRRPRNAWLDL